MPTDAGALFNQGFANGLRLRQQRDARKQQDHDNEIRDREADLDYAIKSKQKEAIERDFAIKTEALKADAAHYVEAEKALEMFNSASSLIDWGKQDAPKQYQAITLQYLPTILKHDAAATKWQEYDKVVKQGQGFTIDKAREAGIMGAYREATQLGIVDFPRDAQGQLDLAGLQQKIDAAKKQTFDNARELRQVVRPTAQRMGPGAKAQIDVIKKQIETIDSHTADISRVISQQGDKALPMYQKTLRDMQQKKDALMRQLRDFDSLDDSAQAEDQGEDAAPRSQFAPTIQAPTALGSDPNRGGPRAPQAPQAPQAPGRTVKRNGFTIRFLDEEPVPSK